MYQAAAHTIVQGHFHAQSGLVTARQVLSSGMTPEHVRGLLRKGVWIRVRRGVYAEAERWESLDPYDERPRMQGRAALLTMRRDSVLSHDSAARELRLPILRTKSALVHVTRRGVRGTRIDHGVKHHLAPYQAAQVLTVDGVPVLDRSRTALDIAREHGYVAGVVACDSARQAGVRVGQLWEACLPMGYWPEVTVVRAAISSSDPGAESVAETLGRLLLEEIGLGPIETQFELRDATGWARCDMRVGRHIVEVDGKRKYTRRDRGGLAVLDPDQVVWEEKRREDWLRSYRLGMSRLVWDDFWGQARDRAKERVLREYAATCAAYGTDISDLARLVVAR